jgi:hypothetical protein
MTSVFVLLPVIKRDIIHNYTPPHKTLPNLDSLVI